MLRDNRPVRPKALPLMVLALLASCAGGSRLYVTPSQNQLGPGQPSTTRTPSTAICSFDVQGAGTRNPLQAGAIQASGEGAVLAATIDCWADAPVTIYGGRSLQPFASRFTGVNFIVQPNIPAATVWLQDLEVDIVASTFQELSAAAQGSILLTRTRASFQDTHFLNNVQSGAGALIATDSDVSFQDCTFMNNTGYQSGAINLAGGSLTVNGSLFLNNSGAQGGAILTQNVTTVSITESRFEDNTAENGGAVHANNCTEAYIAFNNMDYNAAQQQGGALFQVRCPGRVIENGFKHNRAANGAVFLNAATQYVVMDNNFTGNQASQGGASLQIQSTKEPGARIGGNIFRSNAGVRGAGVFLSDVVGDTIDNHFIDNEAAFGGGIFRSNCEGDLSANNFMRNTATRFGGAVYDVQTSGDITGNVFTRNQAKRAAGIFREGSSGSMDENRGLTSRDVDEINPK